MSIIIQSAKMPKEPDEMIEIAIFGDGKAIQTGESWRNPETGKCHYTTTTPEKFFNAVPVPLHGRLIDVDYADDYAYDELEVANSYLTGWEAARAMQKIYQNAPTIIPAEEGE